MADGIYTVTLADAPPTLTKVATFLLIPAVVLMLSGAVGMVRKIPSNVEAGLQHFAGGVVLSAVASELVPEMKKKEAPIWAIVLGFSLGVAMLLFIRNKFPEDEGEEEESPKKGGSLENRLEDVKKNLEALGNKVQTIENPSTSGTSAAAPLLEKSGDDESPKKEEAAHGAIPVGAIVPIAIDLFCDGMLVGLSFAAGAGAGLILAVSIALEMASLGAATYCAMQAKGVSTVKAMCILAALAATIVISGSGAFTLAASIAGTPGYYAALAFGIAACLWLAAEDLLMESHENVEGGEKWWITTLFFAGFLVPILLDKLGGD